MQEKVVKKLGIAMSGSGARSVFYIGFMEVLLEHGIPIHAIAAQSGASLVASAVALGRLDVLKREILGMKWRDVRNLFGFSKTGTGIFSLAKVEDVVREKLTLSKHFEDLKIKLCFPATDLTSGELVPLAYGDLAKAIVTTCSVPGLFEPVRWGNKLLLDGGILSVLPTKVVKDFGSDVVISVSIRATNHVYPESWLSLKSWYNSIKSFFHKFFDSSRRLASFPAYQGGGGSLYSDDQKYTEPRNFLSVTARSMDLALKAKRTFDISEDLSVCDLKVREGEGNFGDSFTIANSSALYEQGRRVANSNLEAIKKLVYG